MPDDDLDVTPSPRGSASGVGSLPGTDVGAALRLVRDLLAEPDDGEPAGVPFLPELPGRGPGADLVGRAAARLVDLPVDLQPSGWRLVERPGRDLARAAAFWREDLDRAAEAFAGWSGALKVQLGGPWTLAAAVSLPRGERAVADAGARRDLVESSAEAVRLLVADLRAAVPGARPVVQVDEPSLPAVLDGSLPTASGLHRVRSVPTSEVADGLAVVVAAARDAGAATVVHCCASDPPVAVLRRSGAEALSLDTTLLGPHGWESVAAAVEDGLVLWAGAVPTRPDAAASVHRLGDRLTRSWRDVGLGLPLLADLVVTPACGLAGSSPEDAVRALRAAVALRRQLVDRATG
ncbi:MAG TPA: methionine synthase [Actinomycetales bacterium]|nr:methionine synthase [Actinomycetales bacterium]